MNEKNTRYGKPESVVALDGVARLVVSGIETLRLRVVTDGQKTGEVFVRMWGDADHIGSVRIEKSGGVLFVRGSGDESEDADIQSGDVSGQFACGGIKCGGDIRIGNVTGQVCFGSNVRQSNSVVINGNCRQSVSVTGNSSISNISQSIRCGCTMTKSDKYDEYSDRLPPVLEIEIPKDMAVKIKNIQRPFEVGDLIGKLTIAGGSDASVGSVAWLRLELDGKADISVKSVNDRLKIVANGQSWVRIADGHVPEARINAFGRAVVYHNGSIGNAFLNACQKSEIVIGQVTGNLEKHADVKAEIKILNK